MTNFKITFPEGYNKIKNIDTGKCNIHIVFDSGKVYYANIFTVRRIDQLLNTKQRASFTETDLLIVKDLSKASIKQAVSEVIDNCDYSFTRLNMNDVFCNLNYDDLIDMNDLPEESFYPSKKNLLTFKIVFPTGYSNTDAINDYIDVNIIFKTGEVYFGTLVTLENIKSFFKKGDSFFHD